MQRITVRARTGRITITPQADGTTTIVIEWLPRSLKLVGAPAAARKSEPALAW